ncbi:Major facilitator superfamily domain-containing protein 8 [Cichlidogyrus casuarinus]|uniref:Major facilitator superfamily domain-containing protein 8 n=1 Tax=Cichlidogyrus casuarinus TaxID=1844966 RepID=A0ABD2PTU6_9PLAT
MINPICVNYLGWTTKEATKVSSILMLLAAIASVVIMYVLHKLMSRFDETFFVFLGFLLMILASVVMIPFHPPGPPLHPIALNETVRLAAGLQLTIPPEKLIATVSSELLNYSLVRNNPELLDLTLQKPGEVGGCDVRNSKFCFDDYGLTFAQFLASLIVLLFGYSISYLSVYQIFATIIVNSNGSFWMGMLTSVGSLSRCVTPLIIAPLYAMRGSLIPFCYVIVTTSVVTSIAVVFYFVRGKKLGHRIRFNSNELSDRLSDKIQNEIEVKSVAKTERDAEGITV